MMHRGANDVHGMSDHGSAVGVVKQKWHETNVCDRSLQDWLFCCMKSNPTDTTDRPRRTAFIVLFHFFCMLQTVFKSFVF